MGKKTLLINPAELAMLIKKALQHPDFSKLNTGIDEDTEVKVYRLGSHSLHTIVELEGENIEDNQKEWKKAQRKKDIDQLKVLGVLYIAAGFITVVGITIVQYM